LPAFGTTLLGLLTGLWLRTRKPLAAKALGLAAGALACLATGYLWSVWFPLNKNLWTSSYVLVAAGWSLAVLALAFWAADVHGWRKRWTWPWLVLGSNAIAAYMFSELVPSALDNIRSRPADGGPTHWPGSSSTSSRTFPAPAGPRLLTRSRFLRFALFRCGCSTAKRSSSRREGRTAYKSPGRRSTNSTTTPFYLRDGADIAHSYDVTGYPEIAQQTLEFFANRKSPTAISLQAAAIRRLEQGRLGLLPALSHHS